MPARKKTVFHWSSGKDSALALFKLLQLKEFQVDHLLTAFNEYYERVTMHGTPYKLLHQQFDTIGIDHSILSMPNNASMEIYEKRMSDKMNSLRERGFTNSAYGDIFLEDLKLYREREMEKAGMETVFPLWQKDTKELIGEFINLGFKAIIICTNEVLGSEFLGREIDHSFINDLPKGIDPCGENGEFHTFCYDGPIFKNAIRFKVGKKIKRSYPAPSGHEKINFWFQDLV